LSGASTLCAVVVVLTLTAGCAGLSRQPATSAVKTGSIRGAGGKRPEQISPVVLYVEVGRFSDELTALVSEAADGFAAEVGTPEARATALAWKTGAANSAIIIATGPNPTANLLDMVVLVSLERMAFEEYWLPHFGKPVEPILAVTRELEEEIWGVAKRVLTPTQQTELRELIREWREKHPEQIYISVRFRDFAEIAAQEDVGANAKPGSLFSLAFLDPFAGLDPTTRELAQTRFFAERALFVLERTPKLLRWQSELVIAQTIATPDVQQLVSNSTRFAQASELLTQTVRSFPDQWVAQAPKWETLMRQFEQTFRAGNEMAVSVDAAVKSLDAFVGRVAPAEDNVGSAAPASPSATATEGASNVLTGPPNVARRAFDVAEYGVAAAEIGKAAQELDALTHSLEKATPQINAVVERAGQQSRDLVDYTFHKTLWLLALALVGFVLALLAYRWLALRLSRKSSKNLGHSNEPR